VARRPAREPSSDVSAGRKITADDAPHGLDGRIWEIGIGKSAAVDVKLAGVRFVAVLRSDDDLDRVGLPAAR